MARIVQTGFEIHHPTDGIGTPDNPGSRAADVSTIRATTTQRTGSGCASIPSASGVVASLFTVAANRTYYIRGYVYLQTGPAAVESMLTVGAADNIVSVRFATNSKYQLWNMSGTPAQIGSDADFTITSNIWYLMELKIVLNGSTQLTDCELIIENRFVASASGLAIAATGAVVSFEGIAGKTLKLDDVAVNDDQGSVNNTWCGPGSVVLMKPSSDQQIGTWTGGAAGTTNLWDAVNNTPPIGVAAETDLTSIETGDSSPDNATDEYRGNCGTYLAAGVPAISKINAIVPWINDGQEVATGTKTGSFALQSNPAGSYFAFTYGEDVGASGTYPTNWSWHRAAIVEMPAVDKSQALILAVRKTDTGTRLAWVDFLGAYVDFTVLPPNYVNKPPYLYTLNK